MFPLERKLFLPSFGDIEIVKYVPGRGYASVHKATLSSGESVALKLSESPTERSFYERLANYIRRFEIGFPNLFWSGMIEGKHAILIEWLPETLPMSHWKSDLRVFKTLATLHSIAGPDFDFEWESHAWHPELTSEALTYFKDPEKLKMEAALNKMRSDYQYLFEPDAILHGDPCGPNWGQTSSGEISLFDWERVGRGHPAIDLAAVSFWQLTRTEFEAISELYLSHRPDLKWDSRQLATEIQIARAYTVLVMLSNQYRGIGEMPIKVLGMLQIDFPIWLFNIR
jgi:thiamine kinase-like enzyme